jgi:Fe-S oxidoreductase/nitrate reductase gamma subunit
VRDFFVHVLGQVRILKKIYPGVMHALIFWGVTVQVIGTAINLMQMQLFVPFVELQFPRGNGYLAYELIMDLAGVAILVGALMAAFRRLVLRPKALETRWDDWYAITLLLLIPLLGFTTEGLRIRAVAPPWAAWSPGGNLVAGLFASLGMTPEAARNIHSVFFWVHIGVALVFVASIPFTKLRHLVMAPLNVITRSLRKPSVLTKIENIEEAEVLGVGEVAAFTPHQLLSFDACLNCGRCQEVCPAATVGMSLSPRALVQELRSVMVDTLVARNGNGKQAALSERIGDQFWYCTTCGACLSVCPAFVNPVEEIVDLRRYGALTTGEVPNSAALALRNIERQSNPWGLSAADRAVWLEEEDVHVLQPGEQTDVLWFVGCAGAFDDRNKKSAKAFASLLKAAGVDFAILGEAEACCGETARRLGNEYLFQVLAQQNIEVLGEYGFKRIVTQCPHCYNTIKNEYPQFGGDFEVLHAAELLSDVAAALPTNGTHAAARVTFHDSCYLGRYNNIYSQPRQLLDRAGVSLTEMKRSKANALCCGGGGGQMWMETDPETRINNLRLTDALAIGADTVATACPYCLLMFDDAIRSTGAGERIRVLDVAEVLAERLES